MNDAELIVHLVDDDAAVRDSLTMLIESEGYTVRAHADAEAFLAALIPGSRGCAVIDLRMPGMDGIRLQQEMTRRGITLPIVFLTGYGDIPTSVRAIKGGAIDFLTKPVSGAELLRSIGAALAAGEAQRAHVQRNSSAASRLADLTEREQGALKLAVGGLSNKEIAKQLGISYRTVEIHRSHIMRKTGADSLIDLARIARDAGIAD